MKANELMIGDWVKFYNTNGEYLTDSRIDINSIYSLNLPNTIIEFKPIPLTAEILEKNGFEKDKEHPTQRCLAGDFNDVYIHEWSDSIWKVEIVNIEVSSIPVSQCGVSFVHELQQFMRLCKIEKEIEL